MTTDSEITPDTQTDQALPPSAEVVPTRGRPTRQVMAIISLVILLLDQLTKQMVRTSIAVYDAVEVIPGFLNLVHVHNTGAAFGFLNSASLANKQLLMTSIAVVALGAILAYAWQVGPYETLTRAGLALILGGAAGNLVDRASVGYVVDFVDVYWRTHHFWAFNVADSAITVGAGLLILDMLMVNRADVSTAV
jgi:signal peptidase II|tara:strand:- start:380 stop:958 length:579 start_codon:yes stop_codon:yes gene_type:complete